MFKKIFIINLFFFSFIYSQNFSGGFNFYLPSSDTTTQKFIPVFPKSPIGYNEFVSINNDGNFSVNGKRVRFWGVNAAAESAFPSKDNTELIAGRLRKFGVNLVRFHHIDNPWSVKSLLGQTSTRQLNPMYLDLLENYIYQLKQNGIYVNMNLHVSRTFRINDNVHSYDSLPEFGKVVNFFDPYIIQLHKEYAQQLLTHINPYTGKSLVNDPVMAMVEITNENSLYRTWRENKLKSIAGGGVLPSRYNKMLDSLWIDFLKKKYSSTSILKSAWEKGYQPEGQNEQIKNGGFENGKTNWELEINPLAVANFTTDNSNPFKGSSSAKIEITKISGTDWHIQFKQPTITIKKDSTYSVSFAIRSSSARNVTFSVMNNNSPWTWYGGKTFQTTTSWQIVTASLKAVESNIGSTRISFSVGNSLGTVWIDDVSFTNAGVKGLNSNESFESNNIVRLDYADCIGYTNQRAKDLSEFYITLQRNYFKEMLGYLKGTLGVKVPIVGTNWNIGPADMSSMSDADYVDNHAYWDHPQFPSIPWSPTDWLINNIPMVTNADGGTISYLFSGVPMAGKPFTVSEYNHASPNIYQSESVLFISAYSAFHDADGVMYFTYDEPEDWNKDVVNSYFDVNRNSIYMAFFPSVSFAFRNGLIKSSVNPITITYSADTLYSLPRNDVANWLGPTFIDRRITLKHAVKTGSFFGNTTSNLSLAPSVSSPFTTDTDEITWNTTDGTLKLNADKIVGAAGYLSKLINQKIGSAVIKDFMNNDFGVFTWLSLSSESLMNSRFSLITLGSKMQNTGTVWNQNYTSVNNNLGAAPTSVYPLRINFELNIQADSLKIYPLNTLGKENILQPFTLKPSLANTFSLNIDQSKYNTLWLGIEKYGTGSTTGIKDELPLTFLLEQNYPNPFNPSTTINYQIPNSGIVQLKVFDVLGRVIETLVDEFKQAGNYSVEFNSNELKLASGLYIYKLTSGSFRSSKKMLLVK